MNPSFAPVELLLLKWTLLLALGWLTHGLLREKHSRWRLILWRSVLCFGLVLPLTALVSFPVLRVPIFSATAAVPETPEILPAAAVGNSTPTVIPNLNSSAKPVAASASANSAKVSPLPSATKPIRWESLLLSLWIFGAAFAGLRLARLQWQLARIRRDSRAVESAMQNQARELQAGLGMKRAVSVRVSGAVTSPFACGLWRPTIMLPENLVATLPSGEISALLAHEIAHFHRHDLFWCVGWRWMQAAFWFHPLIWKIPAAHNLACEQEADRMAASQLADRVGYPQLLARLALRVLALPEVETKLVLSGSSQIAQRIAHLKKENSGAWRWYHSLAGFALVAILFLVVTGCEFSRRNTSAEFPSSAEFKKVLIVVQDADGQPIAGATIKPYGFRVQGVRRVDAYGWNPKPFGPPLEVTTDSEGRAWLKYPVVAFPEE
ncbi:MAG: Thiol-disulfide oxidoreductase ResA, partial [Verrucomicrobiota bacterium]